MIYSTQITFSTFLRNKVFLLSKNNFINKIIVKMLKIFCNVEYLKYLNYL